MEGSDLRDYISHRVDITAVIGGRKKLECPRCHKVKWIKTNFGSAASFGGGLCDECYNKMSAKEKKYVSMAFYDYIPSLDGDKLLEYKQYVVQKIIDKCAGQDLDESTINSLITLEMGCCMFGF